MKINNAVFVTSVAATSNLIIDDKSQIAFVGRSNVGKSSLINMLTNNSKLARTSNTPGRTRLVNYFLINQKMYFVDLPGYGYAKASKSEVENWQGLLEPYFLNNTQLKCVCVLVDSRISPTIQDIQMLEYLNYYAIPFVVVATKIDKFPVSKVKPALNKLSQELRVGTKDVFGVSSVKRSGKEALLDKLDQFIG